VKAAVCHKFGEPLTIEDVQIDGPKAGEVKVRIAAVGICHSDIHLVRGDWGGRLPLIAGHEAAGVVEEIGEGVGGVTPGDRVVVSLLRSCGRCFYCSQGMPNQCTGTFDLDETGRITALGGDRVYQGISVGAFAENVVVHESQVVTIGDGIPFESACLLGCGVITGFGAVVNVARVKAGQSAVVIGCGGVGLNAVQAASIVGANPIVAVDVVDSKLEIARRFGATHGFKADLEDVKPRVRTLTGGLGADFAFVTVGSPGAVAQALSLVRTQGTVVVVGLPAWKAMADIHVFELVRYGKRLVGSYAGDTRLQVEVPRLVDLYRSRKLELDELVTRRYPLSEINDAMAATERGEVIRNVVCI
jgi:S-(hydroxymethyl)glutathione dehydrogenase / alcohol dehydrogenase